MVQEARTGARGRQQSASAATTGRAAGALHTAETGVAKVALRWNNGCGTDTAARAVGLFAKRPGEKLQKRCGGESARRAGFAPHGLCKSEHAASDAGTGGAEGAAGSCRK